MDLFKAFDCVPPNFLVAELEAYGINETYLLTFINIFQLENSAYISIMLQVISIQLYRGSSRLHCRSHLL